MSGTYEIGVITSVGDVDGVEQSALAANNIIRRLIVPT